MPEHDRVLLVVREWVTKAENDLKNAAHTLKLGDECPTDTVCFHAQQCVEKYMKAVLVISGISFPRTHDLEALTALIAAAQRPTLDESEQASLTQYATVARYPGWDPISLTEARRMVALARRVRREMRRILPRAVIRRS